MEILTGTIAKIFEYTVEPIGRQVGYLINYKSNLESLRSQLKNLDAAKDRMKHRVDEVKRNGKGVETDVQNWRQEADEMIEEANTFFEKEGRANTKCFRGVCPNLVSYHQFSRKSAKLAKKIELHAKTEFPSVSYEAPVEDICAIPSQEYMAFESRTSMLKEIMEELKNPDTNMIGVYGLGGVGKTTLAKEVFRQANKEKLFDDVVIILNVKEKKDREIQEEIAEKLGMDVKEHQCAPVRANCLWHRIKDKKTLVIIDDVLGRIDLEAVGLVPVRTCNLLLTSRDKKVLSSEMGIQKNFQLDLLCEQESLSLFEKRAGAVIKDDRIEGVANELAKKCGGLPILVVAVASGLRESSLEEWKDTLRRFKNFEKRGLAEIAFLIIEWSYNQLDSEEARPLFLLCGIMAQRNYGFSLSDLLKYTIGLGLFKKASTVDEARNALLRLVKELKDNKSLLLDGYDDGRFRMHDVVRDVAVQIASRDRHVLSRAYTELDESPSKDCSQIHLRYCTIPKLPDVPWECPELNFFYLGSSDKSLEIPCNFFKKMKELRVLDLTRLHFRSLPPSLQSLTNLQTLCLDQCELGDIALVGQLTNLKILSLIQSQVKELPKEIGQLIRLQLLDLTGCSELVRIPAGVISSLTSLEDLRMGSFKEWEGGFNDRRSNASVSELKQLRQLNALDIHIPDAKLLPANMFSDTRLERYTILIGDCWEYPRIDETSSNMLKLKLIRISQFDQGIKLLLERCENLDLDGMEAANIISYILASDSGKQLKNLHVQNSDAVTAVINSSHAFPNLESLSLDNLVNLETVCCGHPIAQPFQKLRSLTLRNLPKFLGFSSKGSRPVVTTEAEEIISENEIGGPTKLFMNGEVMMPNLTSLVVHRCSGLRFLFSFSMARSLVQLTRLEIASCQIMEEIVTKIGSSEENTYDIFPKLKHLQLQYLPCLTRFCKARNYIETDVQYFLLDEKVGFPSLESLIIRDMPKLRTIWHRQLGPDSFRKLKEVEVSGCDTLINIFAPSMMGRLNALHTLEIKQCKLLQLVFDVGVVLGFKEAYGTSRTQLKTFGCPNLDCVKMDSCNSLKNIFPASVAKGLQQLRMLYVENCGILEEIVAKEGVETTPTEEFVFSKVTHMAFVNLPQLRSFYPGLHVSKWPLLKSLIFLKCDEVKILASEYSRFLPIKQPFLLVDKGNPFPSLEKLYLNKNMELWYETHGPLPAELFINLKEIAFSCAHPQSFHFLQKLHNLELLLVRGGSWKEIFVYEGTSNGEIDVVWRTLPQVKNLLLYEMEELMHLGNDNSESIFPNLEILKVYRCARLENLTSSAISFRNLTTLNVFRCGGLKYLTTYSVAKCLQQLKHLEVGCCESMKEIIASNGDEQDSGNYYEIAFSSLQHLELYDLPLRGFCSPEIFTIKVPLLNSSFLIVKECLIELEISPDKSLIQSGSRPERQQIIEEVEEKEEEEDDGNETGGRTQLIAHTN